MKNIPRVIFRSVRWQQEGWTKNYNTTAVPRRGDTVSLAGEPYTVADVSWCYGEEEDSIVYVYVEVVAHVCRECRYPIATEGDDE